MLEMSWITAILQFYSQVTYRFGNVIVKRINIRLFDLLARFHYILNLPRMLILNVIDNGLACNCGVCRVLIMKCHRFCKNFIP